MLCCLIVLAGVFIFVFGQIYQTRLNLRYKAREFCLTHYRGIQYITQQTQAPSARPVYVPVSERETIYDDLIPEQPTTTASGSLYAQFLARTGLFDPNGKENLAYEHYEACMVNVLK